MIHNDRILLIVYLATAKTVGDKMIGFVSH